MLTDNARLIARQQELIHKLSWNQGFGCHTRAGFEHVVWPDIAAKARWIIYFDIDGMHELNAQHGSYEPVDAMIRQVLSAVRASDYVAGQWKSGDEFLICICAGNQRQAPSGKDAADMVDRLVSEFAKHGMTATFAIELVRSTNLAENVQPALDRVYEQKNRRGSRRVS